MCFGVCISGITGTRGFLGVAGMWVRIEEGRVLMCVNVRHV